MIGIDKEKLDKVIALLDNRQDALAVACIISALAISGTIESERQQFVKFLKRWLDSDELVRCCNEMSVMYNNKNGSEKPS